MLNMMFKRTKILYPALEDFDVNIEKIIDVNDLWHFKNKFNDSIELIIKATKNWKDEKVIGYLEITKDNERYSYKNMPFLICLNTYSNKIIEEFFMKKNNVIQINSYKIICTQTLNKFKKILISKITINNKDSDEIIAKNGNFVGDADNVYLKEYENHKIRQVTRCYNGSIKKCVLRIIERMCRSETLVEDKFVGLGLRHGSEERQCKQRYAYKYLLHTYVLLFQSVCVICSILRSALQP